MLMGLFCNTVTSYDLENCFPSIIFKILTDPDSRAGITHRLSLSAGTKACLAFKVEKQMARLGQIYALASLVPQTKIRGIQMSAFSFYFLHFENAKSLLQSKAKRTLKKSVLEQPQNPNMIKADTAAFQHQRPG